MRNSFQHHFQKYGFSMYGRYIYIYIPFFTTREDARPFLHALCVYLSLSPSFHSNAIEGRRHPRTYMILGVKRVFCVQQLLGRDLSPLVFLRIYMVVKEAFYIVVVTHRTDDDGPSSVSRFYIMAQH